MTRYSARTQVQQPTLANWGKAAAGGIGVVEGYGVGSGGTSSSITDVVAYTLLTFTSDGTLTVATAGLFDVCLVGGGGAGGNSFSNYGTGGGGGGGGVSIQTVYFSAGSWTVDVGAGGSASENRSDTSEGKPSQIYNASNVGIGVAGGGSAGNAYTRDRISTGATGGGGNNGNAGAAGTNFGFAGGTGGTSGAYNGGGGGGGGSAAVGTAGSGTTAGNGGAGYNVGTFIGAGTTNKGGGGGGGGASGGSAGSGNGASNTGGGGAGKHAPANGTGDSGYSGIIYVRFKV